MMRLDLKSASRRTLLALVGVLAACTSSTATTTKAGASGSGSESESSHASTNGSGHDGGESCAASMPCTGSLTGGVAGSLTECTMSGENGVPGVFGEVTYSFSATGDAATGITGSGNLSTSGKFDVMSYSAEAGLWNDMGAAADSLWAVAWTPSSGGAQMAQCNGVSSPDETPSICQGAVLIVTSVDSCKYVHGTLALTIPAYKGTPEVGLQLAF